jgi:hypothetical protein
MTLCFLYGIRLTFLSGPCLPLHPHVLVFIFFPSSPHKLFNSALRFLGLWTYSEVGLQVGRKELLSNSEEATSEQQVTADQRGADGGVLPLTPLSPGPPCLPGTACSPLLLLLWLPDWTGCPSFPTAPGWCFRSHQD